MKNNEEKSFVEQPDLNQWHKGNINDAEMNLPFAAVIIGDTHDQKPLDEPDQEATYLRVIFAEGGEQFFRNWECPDGVWAEEMHLQRTPSCICVKGVYAIGTTLCEDDFKILAGNEHCFDVKGQTIRKFIPLIGKSGFAGKANTVFRKDGPYFVRLMSSTPTTSVVEPMHYVFRMNDPLDFSVYNKLADGKAARLKCYFGQGVDADPKSNPLMQIARLPNCSNEFRGPKDWCDDSSLQSDYEWTLQLGDSWQQSDKQIGKGEKYPGKCGGGAGGAPGGMEGRSGGSPKGGKPKVGKKKFGKRKKRAAKKAPKGKLAGRKDSGGGASPGALALPENVVERGETCDPIDPALLDEAEIETNADHFLQTTSLNEGQKFHSTGFHQKEVDKQNRRIAHQMRKYYLGGPNSSAEVPRFIDFKEFKYVQMSKEILKTVCPKEEVPPYVVDFLIRAFRLLFIDASQSNPYPIKFNPHEHQRAIDALTKCNETATPIDFIMNDTCPDLGVSGTNQSMNATIFSVYEYGSNLSLPGYAAYNISSLDVAVELVWKVTLLTHYYCADKFIETPFDLSLFFVKVEAMLKNPTISFRWYYPGQLNRLLQIFLMSYDLKRFAKGVDRCVATVVASSSYTGWMKRPPQMAEEYTQKSTKLSHDVSKDVNSPKGNFQAKPGRKKRFYMQDDIWKKQAYCMHTTDAPYNEVRTSTFLSCRKPPIWFENTD